MPRNPKRKSTSRGGGRSKRARRARDAYTGANAKILRTYHGPINLSTSTTSGLIELVNLHSSTTTSSSGVGVLATELTFNPNTTVEWASWAARFREYRVLAVSVHYEPYSIVNLSTIAGAPIVVAENKAAALGTPTSYNQLIALARYQVHHVFKSWSFTIRADDYTDLDMGGTASPSSEFSMLLYGDSLSNSILYGRLFITWVVQFATTQ